LTTLSPYETGNTHDAIRLSPETGAVLFTEREAGEIWLLHILQSSNTCHQDNKWIITLQPCSDYGWWWETSTY